MDFILVMSLCPAQLYISEMAHERVRGTLGSCVQLMVVIGIMGAYLAGRGPVPGCASHLRRKLESVYDARTL